MTTAEFQTATHNAVRATKRVSTHLSRRLFAPITDKPQYELSLTKLLAIGFAIIDLHVIETTHAVTWAEFWLALASLATAFGRSMFLAFLNRVQTTTTGSENITRTRTESSSTAVTLDEKITHDIQERRDPSRGFENTP